MPYIGGVFHIQEKGLSPRQHGVAWMLAWSLGVDLGTPRLRKCSCKRSGPDGAHGLGGALESLETCKRSIAIKGGL
jgi:hypothetical protein